MYSHATFEDAIINAGYAVIADIIRDENIHRFGKSKECWYLCCTDWGIADDWSGNLKRVNWFPNTISQSAAKKSEIETKIEAARKARETEHEDAAKRAAQIISQSQKAGSSVYLSSKGVKAHGVYFNSYKERPCIIIPSKDIYDKISTCQFIYDDGSKYFLAGGRKTGCFHVIGNIKESEPINFVEGYATGATMHEATDQAVVVCFDAGNFAPVIAAFREKHPNRKFIIFGDNDAYGAKNTGKLKAEEVAEKYGCTVVLPEFSESSLKQKATDFNDLMILEGIAKVQQQLSQALQRKRIKAMDIEAFLRLKIPPREMLMSPIIPEQGLIMLHAARGIGKTFISLSIAVIIASGRQMFDGKWSCPKPKKVLFVDGEMPQSVLQDRWASIVSGFDIEYIPEGNLNIITPDQQDEGIPDLSTQEGQKLIEEHLHGVKLLIIDNLSALCRTGKENDAESWLPVQEWLLSLRKRGISVLLIHHSNKNGAQRGTSKREDLLDTVITLRRPQDYEASDGARFEVHYEKSRGFCGDDAKPFEVKLRRDEDRISWEVLEIEDLRHKQIISFAAENMTQRDIAKELGISASTVNRILKDAKMRVGSEL